MTVSDQDPARYSGKRVYLEAYGCTLSKSEAGLYVNRMINSGAVLTQDPKAADVRVINTCVVISQTESRMLRRIQELAALGETEITGCLPSVSADSLEMNEIRPVSRETFRDFYRGMLDDVEIREPSIFDGIPINQGCTGNCNFCISRVSRGKLLSRRPQKIVDQVRMQVARGIREVRITSLDSAAYGKDIGIRLPQLVEMITSLDGSFMLRIGMMEPKNTSEILRDLLNSYASNKVYKFLHLPVQSGSDSVLMAMNREYTSSDFIEIVDTYRRKFPGATLSTDIITGYPGEGDREFSETVEILEKTRPNIINVTRFSPRPFTRDFSAVPSPSNVTKDRNKVIQEIHRRISSEEFEKAVGTEEEIMVTERGKRDTYVGRDIYYRPVVIGGSHKLYDRVHCTITGTGETYLIGSPAT